MAQDLDKEAMPHAVCIQHTRCRITLLYGMRVYALPIELTVFPMP